jgi:hypothetical protein
MRHVILLEVRKVVQPQKVKNDVYNTRLHTMMNNRHHHHHHHFSLDDRGLTRTKYNHPLPPTCPVTEQDVVNGAFDAIAGTQILSNVSFVTRP